MDQYPGKNKYLKISRKNYFTGNKKLKHVKMFESFDEVNEVKTKTVAPTTSNLPKDLKDLVTIVLTSTENIEEMSAKLEKELADLKVKQKVVDGQKQEIMDMLKNVKATSAEINTILGKVTIAIEKKEKTPRSVPHYKDIADGLKLFIPKTKKMEEAIAGVYEQFTPKPEVKKWEELTLTKAIKAAKKAELVEEGLKDTVKGLWTKFVDFIKTTFGVMKESSKEYTDAGDKLAETLRQMEEKYFEPTVAESEMNETLDIHNTQIKDVIKDKDGNKWNVIKTSLGGATMKNASSEEEIFKTWKEMHEFGEKVDAPKPESEKKEEPKKK